VGRWWRGSDEEEDEGFDPMNRAARYGTARQRGRVESVTARWVARFSAIHFRG